MEKASWRRCHNGSIALESRETNRKPARDGQPREEEHVQSLETRDSMTHPFFILTHSVYSMHFLRSHCIPSPELGTEDTDRRERSLPKGSRDFVGS